MYDYLPGTVIELERGHDIEDFFKSLFAAGGLVLSQVLSLTGLSTHTVQNWVKRKYIKPPVSKKYDLNQFCAIAIMNMLSGTFSLDSISRMIGYVGLLDGNAAAHIYMLFVRALADISWPVDSGKAYDAVDRALSVSEHGSEVKARLRRVVTIMVMAQLSSVIKRDAQVMLDSLDV